VKIIVDANIVFSGILNSNGKIGYLLINSGNKIDFIAPEFLRKEIYNHYPRLSKISGLTLDQIREAEYQICKDIHFISEEQIPHPVWMRANKLAVEIDPKDTHYIAFSKHFRCKIWSGDKQLRKGLANKKIKNIISTEELYNLLQKIKKKH
jgi:predicted nucleic acid-binding protein